MYVHGPSTVRAGTYSWRFGSGTCHCTNSPSYATSGGRSLKVILAMIRSVKGLRFMAK